MYGDEVGIGYGSAIPGITKIVLYLIKTMLIRAIIQGLTYVEAVDVLGWINTAEDFCDWFVRI